MPRDLALYLDDILEAARRIRCYTEGMDEATFRADLRTVDAVLRNLEVVGEAAKCLPDHVRDRAPEVEWRKIAGMRDFLAHVYFSVNLTIVWDVIVNKLAELEGAVLRLRTEIGDASHTTGERDEQP